MGDKKNSTVTVMSVANYMTDDFKIIKLKFPLSKMPALGMTLIDINNVSYTLSGIVFENESDGTWDCRLNDSSGRLTSGSELRIAE